MPKDIYADFIASAPTTPSHDGPRAVGSSRILAAPFAAGHPALSQDNRFPPTPGIEQATARIEPNPAPSPAPWAARGQFVSDCTETMANMVVIKDAAGKFIGAFDRVEDRALAVAAPAMLAALHEAADALTPPRNVDEEMALETIRAAIAQTKGTI